VTKGNGLDTTATDRAKTAQPLDQSTSTTNMSSLIDSTQRKNYDNATDVKKALKELRKKYKSDETIAMKTST
jgi:hypothetical protein